jgi:hypothetical protein
MYVQLDKDKPFIGSVKGLKLGGGQACDRLGVWLLKPALTDILCISYINVIRCSKVNKAGMVSI